MATLDEIERLAVAARYTFRLYNIPEKCYNGIAKLVVALDREEVRE